MSAGFTVKEVGHPYQPGTNPYRPPSLCGFQHPLWGGQYCGAGEKHEWHTVTHCTDCNDTGIIWLKLLNRPIIHHPQACNCPEGQLMKEFL